MGVSAISLFLKSVGDKDEEGEGVDPVALEQATSQLCTWLSHLPSHLVRLADLEQLLVQWEEEDSGRVGQSGLLRQLMAATTAGQVFLLATKQPTFFRAAPILFPKKIMALMVFPGDEETDRRKKQKLLEIMEDVAKDAPWKFGFSEVMYKETHYSLEAPLYAMRSTWFYRDLSPLHKTALVTYDVFKTTCRSKGHTYLVHRDMPTHFGYYHRDRGRDGEEEEAVPGERALYGAIEFLIEQEILRREVRGTEERFHLNRYWKAEEGIVKCLEELLEGPAWRLEVNLEDKERFERIQGDGAQMAAAKSIISQPVTLISGRGGTGKTEVVSAVLKASEEGMRRSVDTSLISEDGVDSSDSFMTTDLGGEKEDPAKEKEKESSDNGPILYCAPTGKAASVIKKRVGAKAFTIHQVRTETKNSDLFAPQVLASYKLWRAGAQEQPWKFGVTRVVAVDECSMVSIEIFHWLLKYLLEGAGLQKLVLLGDHLQLPSVDPGNFMEDLYLSLKPRGLTVNLLTNHRSGGSIIFSNATRISNQQMPIFDSSKGFSLLLPPGRKVLAALPSTAKAGAAQLPPCPAPLPALVKGRGREPEVGKLELYWSLLRQHRQKFGIEDDENSQIISFLNNECNALNQFGCFVYNHHLVWGDGEGRRMRKQFHVGDKIICTKNSDIPIFVDDKESGESAEDALKVTISTDGKYVEPESLNLKTKNERLMNGNLYKIRAVCRATVTSSKEVEEGGEEEGGAASMASREYYVLDDLAGDIIRASPDMLVKKTKITHAWALSIHKFQGSEADTIVYGLSGSGFESWKHVYTAVTRGKKSVVIVGTWEDLEKAVRKKPIRRQTALGEKVRRMLSGVSIKKVEEEMQEDTVKEELEAPVTPSKLSAMFEDSMRDWGSQEEVLDQIFKDDSPIKDVFKEPVLQESSPGKRRLPPLVPSQGPLASRAKVSGLFKRPAIDSPATYKTTCITNSPATYGATRPQPQAPQFDPDDSFNTLDCSQLEEEAISASQIKDMRRNLVLDVFGSDDDDEDNLEMAVVEAQEDDELERALMQSQSVTNREEMELRETIALSQSIF